MGHASDDGAIGVSPGGLADEPVQGIAPFEACGVGGERDN